MQPSLLDRLTDAGGAVPPKGVISRYDAARQFENSLRRDLAALLNTPRAERDFDPGFEQAANSLLTFGVTDFTSYNLNSTLDQERVRQSIERAIRQFEPRLTGISVSLEQPEPFHLLLMLRVEAVLQTADISEPVTFEAALYRDSRRIVFPERRRD